MAAPRELRATTPDRFGRPLRSLRLSVTDRCNLRCRYCMPEESYVWLPRAHLLTFEEIVLVVRAFVALGVDRLRLTGGEPLLRQELPALVAALRGGPEGPREIALTTNGVTLAEHAGALRAAGLDRITVSLDSLRADRFAALTGRDRLDRVLDGIDAAAAAGFTGTKINTVVMRGFNDDELEELLAFGRARELEVRFIEYMDVGGATRWAQGQVVTRREIVARLGARPDPHAPHRPSAPARTFVLPDGTRFGIIASVSEPFCGACDRARLTADGTLFTCLYGRRGLDLRALVRGGAEVADLCAAIEAAWRGRTDRGAEDRLRLVARGPLAEPGALAADPHLEMHTRGG